MREREQHPHLKAVPREPAAKNGPSVEVIDAPPAVQYGPDPGGAAVSVAEAAGLPAQRHVIGQVPQPMATGIDWGYHALLLSMAAFGGGLIGYLGSGGSARGAGTGALASITLQSIITAVRGAMLSQPERLGYGVLSVGAAAATGYLFWTDPRRGGRRRR